MTVLGLIVSTSLGHGPLCTHARACRTRFPTLPRCTGHAIVGTPADMAWQTSREDVSEPDYCPPLRGIVSSVVLATDGSIHVISAAVFRLV